MEELNGRKILAVENKKLLIPGRIHEALGLR